MLKVGGVWCSSVEIEDCLNGHPAALESAVVCRADALIAHCEQTLAP